MKDREDQLEYDELYGDKLDNLSHPFGIGQGSYSDNMGYYRTYMAYMQMKKG